MNLALTSVLWPSAPIASIRLGYTGLPSPRRPQPSLPRALLLPSPSSHGDTHSVILCKHLWGPQLGSEPVHTISKAALVPTLQDPKVKSQFSQAPLSFKAWKVQIPTPQSPDRLPS